MFEVFGRNKYKLNCTFLKAFKYVIEKSTNIGIIQTYLNKDRNNRYWYFVSKILPI